MTLGELNTLINENVYENTERAITGGALQNVLQGMMGAFFGTSSLSGLGSIASQDMRDAIGTTLGSNSSLISQLANNLASNSTFGSNLAYNGSLISQLANKLATNSTFGSYFAYNSAFSQNLATNYTFTQKFGSYLATNYTFGQMLASSDSTLATSLTENNNFQRFLAGNNNFQSYLGCRTAFSTGYIPYELVYNSAFISGLKSQLGL